MADPTLVHESDGLLVVDKPAGWLVHPAGTEAPDLLAWLAEQGHDNVAPVHRLDRGTSGICLYATAEALEPLAKAFADGTVSKRYLALVYGSTRAKGTIDRPLKDGRRDAPLEARTRYRTTESFGKWSLLEVWPETGKKHQIRRHLQGIGHAVVGDDRYRPRGKKTVPAFPGRLWLHAASLELPDGRRFEAPLPPELQAHLAVLRERAKA